MRGAHKSGMAQEPFPSGDIRYAVVKFDCVVRHSDFSRNMNCGSYLEIEVVVQNVLHAQSRGTLLATGC